jgi:hypothetical protein
MASRPVSISQILQDLDDVLEKTAEDNQRGQGGVKSTVMHTTEGGGQPAEDAAEVALRKGHKITQTANPETTNLNRAEGNVGEKTDQNNTSTGPAASKSAEEAAQQLLSKIQDLLSKSAKAADTVAATPQGVEEGMDEQIKAKGKYSKHEEAEKKAAEKPSEDEALYNLSKKAGELVAENMIMSILAQNAQAPVEKQANAYVADLEKKAAAVLQQAQLEKIAAQHTQAGAAWAQYVYQQEMAKLAAARQPSEKEQMEKGAALAEALLKPFFKKAQEAKAAEATNQVDAQLNKLAELVVEQMQKKK